MHAEQPAAAKAAIDFAALTALLKPRPFKTRSKSVFFRKLLEQGNAPFEVNQSAQSRERSSDDSRCKLIDVNILYGINTVTEALKGRGRNFEWVGVAKERKDIRLRRVIDECRKIGVPVRVLSRMELDEIAGNAAHQGLVAATSAKQYSDLDDIVA
ncbi:MAG: RNA methyltransferase substrate-binding domain-containing protein, partial [Terriglobales bacterium]